MDRSGRLLGDRRLIVVTGKGGVGKSTVAALLGRRLAAGGRRALVLEIDPRESVHQMLGVAPSGGEIAAAGPGLWLQNLPPRRVVDALVRERVRPAIVARRVLASPIYDQFTEGAPGLKESAVLGHALRLLQGRVAAAPPVDAVVLDAPATGHGLSLLAAPRLLAEAIGRGPIADLVAEVAGLIADPEASAIVVATLAEEMPVTEALELRRALAERIGRAPELLVVNRLYPPLDGARPPRSDPLGRLWHDRRRLNERELERLRRGWQGAAVELPLLPLGRGPRLLDALLAALPDSPGREAAP